MEKNVEVNERLRQIKSSFRLMMNGVAAQSMREKGLEYHINWGVSLPALKEMARKYGKDYDLAIALWKENIRECKILATMIMPAEVVLPEVIDIWMSQIPTIEIAEQASMNLYQYLPYAHEKAYQWIAASDEKSQLCGFHVFSRLFMRGWKPDERGINEYMDQALSAVRGESVTVRKAVLASVVRFAELGDSYQQIAKGALKTVGIDF